MSIISFDTAYEIVTHRGDLHICICKGDRQEVYTPMIMRGPAQHFRPLLSSEPCACERNEAVRAVREVLELSRAEILRELERPQGFMGKRLRLSEHGLDPRMLLSQKDINRIIYRLYRRDAVETHALFRSHRVESLHPHPIQ